MRQDARLRPVPRARQPPKRWRPLPQPLALEASYTEAVVGMVDRAFAVIRRALAKVLEEAAQDEREDAAHLDAKPKKRKASVTFEIIMEDLPEKVEEPFSLGAVKAASERVAKEADATHLRAVRKQFSEAVGVQVLKAAPELKPVVRDFTKRNVALIKSLPEDILPKLRNELAAALDSGARPTELAKLLEERYGVARRKAEFIARDQVGKLYSSLTEERHKALGITRYKWRTSRDNRVRKRHVKREGVVFEYANPPKEDPTDGHAGTPPRCRCGQEPIIDDVLPPAQAVKREQETVDPAPPEAPRPPRSVVPVEKVTQVLEKAKRAARAVTPKPRPAVPSTQRRATPKAAKPPPAPVDRTKGWTAERVYLVPVAELADVPALVWQEGRAESIRKARSAGDWKKLPPIRVYSENKQGARELADGNHRLAVARETGEEFIAVRFSDRAAAGLIARPKNPGLPWFARENPERFPELANPDGTPKKSDSPVTVREGQRRPGFRLPRPPTVPPKK